MATPVFCCGFECGVLGTSGQHWELTGTGALDTSTKKNGARAIRINPTSAVAHVQSLSGLPTGGVSVLRFYFNNASNPAGNAFIGGINVTGGRSAGLVFQFSDTKYYIGTATSGAVTVLGTGVTLSAGWHLVDIRVNSQSNPWSIDITIDGTSLGNQTNAQTANVGAQRIMLGTIVAATMDMYYDDVILSHTSADYPIGAGKVEPHTVVADGTHSIAGTNDFERGTSPTDILNSTTDAYTLVDDVPLTTTLGTEYINMIAPPSAADYVECVFGPAPGISAPTTAPRAVEVIAAIAQAGTGAGNMEIRLNDNGTTDPVYSATGVAGVVAVTFKRKHYASGPAGAWVLGGGGNGDFTDLRVQFGSPAALDVNPDQFFKSIMIEAEFLAQNSFSLTVNPAIYAFTTQAATLLAARKLVATNAVYSFTAADVTLRKGYKLAVQEAVYAFTTADATFSLTRKLIVTEATYSFTTQTANLRAQRKLVVTEAVYSFTPAEATFRVARKMTVDPVVYNYTGQDVSLLRGLKFAVDPASYSFTTVDAGLKAHRKLPATEASYLFTAQNADLIYDQPGSGNFNFPVDPAVYNFTTSDAGLRVQRKLTVDNAVYAFSTEDAGLLAQRRLPVVEAEYIFTTEDAGLNYGTNIVFPVSPATYVFTTGDVTFIRGRIFHVEPASYLFTASSANLSARFKQYIVRKSKIANDGYRMSTIRAANLKSKIENGL